ncbi:hypothetical protein HY410_01815 [Candidatus Gottesmanbacteria bacterium]|nr:hypothetical protein [Candidatus Gottesmanbacteria bacterium]
MNVTVSVPGKVHLMGEHAVVYGKPALLCAVNKRMYITVTDAMETRERDTYIHFILGLLEKELKQRLPPLLVSVSSDVPPGYHLGTSAMVAVGIIAAVLYAVKKVWNPERVNMLAYEAEKKQHGNPSGGDNTCVTFGGLLWYRKEFELLKSMWQLPFKPATKFRHFYLIKTTRPKETTGEMVARVAQKVKKENDHMELIFAQNERQTRRLAIALKVGDEKTLISAMRDGEATLEEMGVVSEKVKPLIRKLEKSGGAAKILGGGGITDGVGYLLCYHHHPPASAEPIVLGEEGLRLEKH